MAGAMTKKPEPPAFEDDDPSTVPEGTGDTWGPPLRKPVVQKATPEHEWEFYMNGSFCRRCGAQIGSGVPCR
jgi:hypothetical protein